MSIDNPHSSSSKDETLIFYKPRKSVMMADNSNNNSNGRAKKDTLERRISTSQRIVDEIGSKCTQCNPFKWILTLFPIISWLRNYSIKECLLSDIISGFTISVMHIPQGMAYGLLAGVSAINGLYVSFFPVLVYVLMGTSRHVSIGTFAVVSIMVRSAAEKLGAIDPVNFNLTSRAINSSGLQDLSIEDQLIVATPIQVLTSMCFTTGFIMVGMGLLHMGILSLILSDQLVSAFSSGAAMHVATSQTSALFDIHTDRLNGPLKLVYSWINIVEELKNTNFVTMGVSIAAILLIVFVKEFVEVRLKKRYQLKIPLPIDLVVIIGITVISYLLKLEEKYSVSVMGHVPTGLPEPELPRIDIMTKVIPSAVTLAIVTFAVSLSLSKMFAKKHKYSVKPNQELIAIGCANIFSSFFGCYTCSASLSRSSVQEKAGGKTQMAGIVSCLILLLVLLVLGPLVYHLPKCILSCVILVALKGMFVQIGDCYKIFKTSRMEGLIWLITFLGVVLTDVDIGLIIGILFSILTILVQFIRPNSSLLGLLPSSETDIYVDKEYFPEAQEVDGVKIFQYSSALFFLNTEHFKESFFKSTLGMTADEVLEQKSSSYSKMKHDLRLVIIDCSCISYCDSSGVEALAEVMGLLRERSIPTILVSCPSTLLNILERTGFKDSLGLNFNVILPTVHDALLYSEQF